MKPLKLRDSCSGTVWYASFSTIVPHELGAGDVDSQELHIISLSAWVWSSAIILWSKSCVGCRIQVSFLVTSRSALIVEASSVADGVVSNASASSIPPSGSSEQSVAVDKTPFRIQASV